THSAGGSLAAGKPAVAGPSTQVNAREQGRYLLGMAFIGASGRGRRTGRDRNATHRGSRASRRSRWRGAADELEGGPAVERVVIRRLLLQGPPPRLADLPGAPGAIAPEPPVPHQGVPRPLRGVPPARQIRVRGEGLEVHLPQEPLHELADSVEN